MWSTRRPITFGVAAAECTQSDYSEVSEESLVGFFIASEHVNQVGKCGERCSEPDHKAEYFRPLELKEEQTLLCRKLKPNLHRPTLSGKTEESRVVRRTVAVVLSKSLLLLQLLEHLHSVLVVGI